VGLTRERRGTRRHERRQLEPGEHILAPLLGGCLCTLRATGPLGGDSRFARAHGHSHQADPLRRHALSPIRSIAGLAGAH